VLGRLTVDAGRDSLTFGRHGAHVCQQLRQQAQVGESAIQMRN